MPEPMTDEQLDCIAATWCWVPAPAVPVSSAETTLWRLLMEVYRLREFNILAVDAANQRQVELSRALEELKVVRAELEMAGGCLNMIRDRLQTLGCPHGEATHLATPPMMYDDWIVCCVRHAVKREQELFLAVGSPCENWQNYPPHDAPARFCTPCMDAVKREMEALRARDIPDADRQQVIQSLSELLAVAVLACHEPSNTQRFQDMGAYGDGIRDRIRQLLRLPEVPETSPPNS